MQRRRRRAPGKASGASLAITPLLPHYRSFEDFVDKRKVAFRTNDVHAQREAAASGMGIATLAGAVADEDNRVERVPREEPPERPLWLLVHPHIPRAVGVGVVIDHLADIFAKDARFAC
jgi:DNA-binding transcriptional LysR family regulator